jgi:hypothetical protein
MEDPYRRNPRCIAWPMLAILLLAGACATCHKRRPEGKLVFPILAAPSPPPAPNAAERLPMIPGQPLFNLGLDIDNCPYILYLNGGLVSANMEGTAQEDQPINHWLLSGTNEIELHMYQQEDGSDQCDAKVRLTLKDEGHDKDPEATGFTLAYSAAAAASGDATRGSSPVGMFDSRNGFRPSDHGDLKVGPTKLANISGSGTKIRVLSRSFDLHLWFPRWAFFGGDKLRTYWEFANADENKPTYREILGAYRKVWSLLEKRDVNGFLDACEERSRETDAAYYKRPGKTRELLRKSLESAMNDPKFELSPVDDAPGEYWTYTVGSTGKLIALTQGERASPIIRYVMKDGTPFSLIFPVVLRSLHRNPLTCRHPKPFTSLVAVLSPRWGRVRL